jgi:hypothetical protein
MHYLIVYRLSILTATTKELWVVTLIGQLSFPLVTGSSKLNIAGSPCKSIMWWPTWCQSCSLYYLWPEVYLMLLMISARRRRAWILALIMQGWVWKNGWSWQTLPPGAHGQRKLIGENIALTTLHGFQAVVIAMHVGGADACILSELWV